MSIAIHYSAIKPLTGRMGEVFGLQVAIGDWLQAYFRFGRTEKFTLLIGNEQEQVELTEIAKIAGIDAARLVMLDRRFPEQNFSQFTTIFRPEPDTRNLLWQRQFYGSYSFCGLAHAISGTEAGEALQEYCLAPSEVTDAIVCPSRAVQAAVRAFFDHYGDYLKMRFGASYQCPVQLPVIPLGIDIEKFERRSTPDKRADQRRKLGIGENDIVLLWVGRLSAAIKAHPLAMYRAAEMAAQKTGAKVHLLMVGYFVPHAAEKQFKDLATAICRTANIIFLHTHDPRFPDGLWAAADIFLSLIDNYQESFGLTPIEAMAAGLPRVISDWDGYRDSVTDGEDGFLIRTTMPPAGHGFELTAQVLNGRELYGGFLAKAALTVAVDAEQAADRIVRLITDKNMRAIMASKALRRAKANYDWRHIIPAYENLWAENAAKRAASPPLKPQWKSALPTLADPYAMYASFPAASLAESDVVSVAATVEQIKILWQSELNIFANDSLIAVSDITVLLGWLAEAQTAPISAIFARFPTLDRPRLWRTIAWLQKLGIIGNNAG